MAHTAEARTRGTRGAGMLQTVLMIVAILTIGGFLYYLWVTQEEEVQVDTSAEEEVDWVGNAVILTLNQFAPDPPNYMGSEIGFENLRVASRMGSQAFWVELPDGTPYLVKLDSALVAQGLTIQSQDTINVAGTVYEMSDSVLAAWEEMGAIADENQRMEAEFATTFFQAERARTSDFTMVRGAFEPDSAAADSAQAPDTAQGDEESEGEQSGMEGG